MSPDPRTASTEASEPAAVLEWGGTPDDDGETTPRRRFGAPGQLAREFLDDRHLVPLAASLGAVGLFVSLVSEWQVTSVEATIFGGGVGRQPITSGVADLGGWGGGYLAGLFLLAAAAVLLLFGPPVGRRYARLVALSTGGVLLAMLVAVVADLDDDSRSVEQMVRIQLDSGQYEITYGRGVWCALFGVAATTVAVYLAGRHLAAEPVRRAVTAAEPESAGAATDATSDGVSGDWLWRRQPTDRDDDEVPEAPLGLTVSPATPFTSPVDNHDQLR